MSVAAMVSDGAARVPFLNAHIHNVSFEEAIEVVRQHVASRVPGFMVSLNTDIVVRLEQDSDFRAAYDAASLALMDSQPLIWLARHCGIHIKEKLSGSDLMPRVCEVAAQEGWSCFFLGGRDGVPEKAASNLERRCPGLIVAGTLSPTFGFEQTEAGILDVAEAVRSASPDIMFICLGTPKSEKLLHPHLDDFGVPFTFSVGAAIDFAAGNVRRAPAWMQRAGLEWLYRFAQEPSRLFRRYFVDSWKVVGVYRRFRREVRHANRG